MVYLPVAEVAPVRSLAEKSETLDIKVNGTVVPYREIELAAETAGRIIEKDNGVRSGNYVRKGQILFRIDPRDYELEVERLTRKRDQELAAIKELNLEIENTKLLLEVAEEELVLAQAEVKRLESLGRNFSSAAELDQAKRSRLTSLNQKVNIQNQIRAFESRQSRLALAAKLAETELEQARLDLERTVVTSPVDGRIVSGSAEADSYVQRGAQLVVIEDTSKVEVACNVRMGQLHWILDQAALSAEQFVTPVLAVRYELPPTEVEIKYYVAGREGFAHTWKGVLDRFDGSGLDPQSRTVPIRIRVDHPEQLAIDGERSDPAAGLPMLVRGMYVEAVIKAQPATNLLLVPKLSIKPTSGTSLVWKFVPDPEAVNESAMAEKVQRANQQNSQRTDAPGNRVPSTGKRDALNETTLPNGFKPDDWTPGFLEIVSGVRVIRAYWDPLEKIDYWVCEVQEGSLAVGDQVVITPLPKIKGDGRDALRIPKSDQADDQKLAATESGVRS
jgi:multidrug efflux pump subunit AcrA (membrane-fusion protein)